MLVSNVPSQRKRGLMNRIRGAATALGLALLVVVGVEGVARAQDITGGVVGRVSDKDTGMPLGGVTVIMQGPQGEDATLTDDKGDYYFLSLPVGTYTVRFYAANASTQVEQGGIVVTAARTVRVNAKIVGAVAAAAQQTYVITGKPPAVDIGSARVGAEFGTHFMESIPMGRDYGDVINHAPGTFFDPSGNVSIGGATGLENIYIVNGLNVTGIEYGNLEAGVPSIMGGTNLPLEFLTQVEVNSGGYQAEYGGAMGGVINTVLKSGSNEYHGSAFTYWAPYWLAADPNPVTTIGRSLGFVRKPDFDTSIGVEGGGPLIKDKLFFWAGFAPRFQDTHVFRLTYALSEPDANGVQTATELKDWRARIPESRQTYFYAATLDYIPRPEHHLTVAAFGTPNFNDQERSFNNVEFISNPAWAQERVTKNNADASAHWTSKLYDRRWQIDALLGVHTEYYYDRSPNDALNSQNQLDYWGANLWDLEHAPGCQPVTNADGTIFQPCPVDQYHTGGFGLVKKATGARWNAEIKSTHLFEAGGHHEVKYGWHLDYTTYDQDRYYSGPLGSRGLVEIYPGSPDPTAGNFNHQSFFTLHNGEYPSTFGSQQPYTNLFYPPDYQDALKASVKSIANAFFLQDSYSPQALRNLTVNVGARLELQNLYDFHGNAFLDAKNLSPRFGAIYDPLNDGRSKVSVSFGRYYEAIPLDVAARYFGGEGIIVRQGVPLASCNVPNPYQWQGSDAQWRDCNLPAKTTNATAPNDMAGNGYFVANNGSNYPVQANLAGQYHNEVVATAEREVMEDMTVRLDYQHRWLGTILEDGTADPSTTFVLANPGHVPTSALQAAQHDLDLANAAATANPMDPNLAAAASNAQAKLTTLQGLAAAPTPERTYDAITLSLNKRFGRNWLARGSYTYSRLVGNYEGLFQTEQLYFAPNGNNAYDTPDLYLNQNGPLPNDRPHNFKLYGSYSHPVGRGHILAALSFDARSGMPRNYISALLSNQQLIMLLPRGSAGRTPTVTELDARLGYSRALTPKVTFDAFIDLFNILDQQTTLLTDDNYTFDIAGSIVNGTPADLKYAKSVTGAPITKNPNYGQALAFQQPFHGRLGLRLTF
jgi:hypothetical protein